MKKKIWAMLLASLMVFSTATVFAEAEKNYDEKLKAAIVKAKNIFDIESRYSSFHSTVDENTEGLYFHLEWRDKETDDSVYVLMNGEMKVEEYNLFHQGKVSDGNPKVSSEQAMQNAKEWLAKLRELKKEEYKIEEEKRSYRRSDQYVFRITRLWEGIPLEGSAMMELSSKDGTLLSFNWGLIDNIDYPSTEKLLSKEDAAKIYRKESGLSRYAQEFYDYEKDVFFYRTYFSENLPAYSIDAVTGKLVKNSMNPRGYGMGADKVKSAEESGLSPAEKQAVNKVKGAISQEKAVETARKLLEIPEEFILKEVKFHAASRSPKEDIGTWRLRFVKEKKPERLISIYVNVDAKTADVMDYSFHSSEEKQGAVISADVAKKTAEDFAQKLQPSRWKETVPSKENRFVAEGDRRAFTYERKIGDTFIATDYISIEVNPMTGKVENYHFRWKKRMPTVLSGGLSMEKAYGIQEAEAPLELVGEAYYPEDSGKPVGRFVWRPTARDLKISAENGKLLDYSGQWKPEEIRYSDLEGSIHRAAIEALLKRDMGFRGGKFEEDKKLTQVEFFYLLGSEQFSFSDIMGHKEEVYKWAMRRGLIQKEEILPTAVISKLDVAKLVVRQSGWEELAKKSDIFVLPFSDAKLIKKSDAGYFALAYAKGVLMQDKSGKLIPYAELTRGEAAELLVYCFK